MRRPGASLFNPIGVQITFPNHRDYFLLFGASNLIRAKHEWL